MKRPFALIGITYLSVQAALFYLESDLAATILTAVCFIETIVSLFIRSLYLKIEIYGIRCFAFV